MSEMFTKCNGFIVSGDPLVYADSATMTGQGTVAEPFGVKSTDLFVQEPLYTGTSGSSAYIGCNINETLLYSGNDTNSFTTTEVPTNFEYLRVHYTRGGNMGYISLVEPNNTYITYGGLIYDVNEGAHLQEVAGCYSSTNGLNWTVAGQNRRWNVGTTGVNGNTLTGQHYITKIVGINRKV